MHHNVFVFVAFIAVLIVIGIAGTLLPFVPGIGLVWAAIVLFAIVESTGVASWVTVSAVSVIAILAIYAGFRLPQRAADEGGLSFRGQVFALALAVVGFIVIPVVGAALGFVAGLYLASLTTDRSRAWQATKATLRALLIASGVQFAASCAMGLIWLAWVVGNRVVG